MEFCWGGSVKLRTLALSISRKVATNVHHHSKFSRFYCFLGRVFENGSVMNCKSDSLEEFRKRVGWGRGGVQGSLNSRVLNTWHLPTDFSHPHPFFLCFSFTSRVSH